MLLKNRLTAPLQFSAKPLTCAALLLATLAAPSVWAQKFPTTPKQRATANQVAEAGVPLSELSPTAPDSYTVKRGNTLWGISKIFLKSPWRWPELWGMNLEDIKNPHLIYPGQVLYLDKSGGRARLSTRRPGELETIKVSPRVRSESLSDSAIPTVSLQAIEPFLTEALIVDEGTFARAPRIVANRESRVLISQGDRVYARSSYGSGVDGGADPLVIAAGKERNYRVFRSAIPLKDPTTGEVLGYEAQYVGKAYLARSESVQPAPTNPSAKPDEKRADEVVPATIDILLSKEEMREGDRLLPEPPRDFSNYVPRAPEGDQSGQIVSVYGNGVSFAGPNQVVTINRGRNQGIETGHVLALLRDANVVPDKTDAGTSLRLPGERNGLIMVFRVFDKVSYALVLETGEGAKVGDRYVKP